jgi:hypothetical protein
MKTIDHPMATAPRLVEYHDGDPCAPLLMPMAQLPTRGAVPATTTAQLASRYRGVTIEANYDVGNTTSILSGRRATAWSTSSTTRLQIRRGADAVLGSYISEVALLHRQGEYRPHGEARQRHLRPPQVRYETPKFMLPIRLGTVNANGPVDLIIYALSCNAGSRPRTIAPSLPSTSTCR